MLNLRRALGTTPGNYLTQVQDFQVWGYYADGATGTGVTPGAQYVGVSNTVGVFMDGDGTGDDIATAKTLTADDGALIMLPQTTVKWATVDGTPVTVADADAAKNSYLVITCKIKTTDGTYLVGSDSSFGTVYVPFAANWERSKKYNYTIVFGTGTGGFDADGNLVFQPISYSASVEDWTPVDGGQLDS